ncbi:serine-rich adhesin for platelets-like, partial [Trifolium medium]|nr:serine-rich adhesin for platelets-like [Trifolium medium]
MNDPPPSEVVSIHGATGDNDIQRVTTVESSSAEGKEEIATETTKEAGISALVGSSEQETAPCPVKETEKLHPSDTSGHLICDMASDSIHDIGTHGVAKIGEPQRAIDEKVTQDCTEEISIPPVLCESSEKQGDGVTISVIKDDKETLPEIHDKSSSKEL